MGIYLKNLVYAVGVVYHGEKMNGRVNNQTRFSRYKDNNGNNEIIYYTLNKKSRFTYTTQNDIGQRIQRTGFHGEIRFKNDLFMPKASFVDFEELRDAAMIFKCAHRISHPRVLRTHFYSEYRDNEDSDCMFLVCFEKFDGFLNDVSEPYSTFLANPSYLYQPGDIVPGNPNLFVQAQIRELNDAVIKMHAGKVSSSNLNLIDGYFWCKHDLTIKIMADIHIALDDVTNLGSDLLKFIRNVYEHRGQTSLSVDVIFKDIQRKWPHLLYPVHELLSGDHEITYYTLDHNSIFTFEALNKYRQSKTRTAFQIIQGNPEIINYTLNYKSRFTFNTVDERRQSIQRTCFHGQIRENFMFKFTYENWLLLVPSRFEC